MAIRSSSGERVALLLLHIPRTGGTSLARQLATRFPLDRCLLWDQVIPTEGIDPNPYDFIEVASWAPLGPMLRTKPFVITCIRDPMERAISQYLHIRAGGSNWQNRAQEDEQTAAMFEAVTRLDFGDLLRKEPELARREFGNVQSRIFSDPHPAPGGEVLEDALAGLRRCDVVLVTERLGEASGWLGERIGCGSIAPLPRINSTPRASGPSLDPETRELLAELTAVDRGLHAAALELYESERNARAAPPAWDAPPSAADFTFDQGVRGGGWEPRETYLGKWFCWIGEGKRASIDLSVEGSGDQKLRCAIAFHVTPESLRGVGVEVNGVPVKAKVRRFRSRVWLTARIPEEVIAKGEGVVRLAFSVQTTGRPMDWNPDSRDARELGIALSRIRLRPKR